MGTPYPKLPPKAKISEDKELMRIVYEFSKGLCYNYRKNSHRTGMCFIVAAPLQTYLSLCGYDTELFECEIKEKGETHIHYCLITKDNYIIDATAGQFKTPEGERMPKVYIGKKPKWYKKIK